VKTIRIDELIAPQETPLVVRTSFARTFFGLVLFATVVLMLGGIYLFTEVMLEPLKAADTSIIASGFTVAVGETLMTFLIQPGKREALAKPEKENAGHGLFRRPLRTIRGTRMPARKRAEPALAGARKLPGPM
jgi:hypothetical protein